jgi:hypothetical protein
MVLDPAAKGPVPTHAGNKSSNGEREYDSLQVRAASDHEGLQTLLAELRHTVQQQVQLADEERDAGKKTAGKITIEQQLHVQQAKRRMRQRQQELLRHQQEGIAQLLQSALNTADRCAAEEATRRLEVERERDETWRIACAAQAQVTQLTSLVRTKCKALVDAKHQLLLTEAELVSTKQALAEQTGQAIQVHKLYPLPQADSTGESHSGGGESQADPMDPMFARLSVSMGADKWLERVRTRFEAALAGSEERELELFSARSEANALRTALQEKVEELAKERTSHQEMRLEMAAASRQLHRQLEASHKFHLKLRDSLAQVAAGTAAADIADDAAALSASGTAPPGGRISSSSGSSGRRQNKGQGTGRASTEQVTASSKTWLSAGGSSATASATEHLHSQRGRDSANSTGERRMRLAAEDYGADGAVYIPTRLLAGLLWESQRGSEALGVDATDALTIERSTAHQALAYERTRADAVSEEVKALRKRLADLRSSGDLSNTHAPQQVPWWEADSLSRLDGGHRVGGALEEMGALVEAQRARINTKERQKEFAEAIGASTGTKEGEAAVRRQLRAATAEVAALRREVRASREEAGQRLHEATSKDTELRMTKRSEVELLRLLATSVDTITAVKKRAAMVCGEERQNTDQNPDEQKQQRQRQKSAGTAASEFIRSLSRIGERGAGGGLDDDALGWLFDDGFARTTAMLRKRIDKSLSKNSATGRRRKAMWLAAGVASMEAAVEGAEVMGARCVAETAQARAEQAEMEAASLRLALGRAKNELRRSKLRELVAWEDAAEAEEEKEQSGQSGTSVTEEGKLSVRLAQQGMTLKDVAQVTGSKLVGSVTIELSEAEAAAAASRGQQLEAETTLHNEIDRTAHCFEELAVAEIEGETMAELMTSLVNDIVQLQRSVAAVMHDSKARAFTGDGSVVAEAAAAVKMASLHADEAAETIRTLRAAAVSRSRARCAELARWRRRCLNERKLRLQAEAEMQQAKAVVEVFTLDPDRSGAGGSKNDTDAQPEYDFSTGFAGGQRWKTGVAEALSTLVKLCMGVRQKEQEERQRQRMQQWLPPGQAQAQDPSASVVNVQIPVAMEENCKILLGLFAQKSNSASDKTSSGSSDALRAGTDIAPNRPSVPSFAVTTSSAKARPRTMTTIGASTKTTTATRTADPHVSSGANTGSDEHDELLQRVADLEQQLAQEESAVDRMGTEIVTARRSMGVMRELSLQLAQWKALAEGLVFNIATSTTEEGLDEGGEHHSQGGSAQQQSKRGRVQAQGQGLERSSAMLLSESELRHLLVSWQRRAASLVPRLAASEDLLRQLQLAGDRGVVTRRQKGTKGVDESSDGSSGSSRRNNGATSCTWRLSALVLDSSVGERLQARLQLPVGASATAVSNFAASAPGITDGADDAENDDGANCTDAAAAAAPLGGRIAELPRHARAESRWLLLHGQYQQLLSRNREAGGSRSVQAKKAKGATAVAPEAQDEYKRLLTSAFERVAILGQLAAGSAGANAITSGFTEHGKLTAVGAATYAAEREELRRIIRVTADTAHELRTIVAMSPELKNGLHQLGKLGRRLDVARRGETEANAIVVEKQAALSALRVQLAEQAKDGEAERSKLMKALSKTNHEVVRRGVHLERALQAHGSEETQAQARADAAEVQSEQARLELEKWRELYGDYFASCVGHDPVMQKVESLQRRFGPDFDFHFISTRKQ